MTHDLKKAYFSLTKGSLVLLEEDDEEANRTLGQTVLSLNSKNFESFESNIIQLQEQEKFVLKQLLQVSLNEVE